MINGLKYLYLLLVRREYQKFLKALETPSEAQNRILLTLIKELNKTTYGQSLGRIKTVKDFKNKVPIIEYDQIRPLIEVQKQSSKPLLHSRLPKIYEYTSGSSGSPKPIPYTRDLLKSFQKLFKIWSYDLLSNAPLNLKSHHFFISVSPLFGEHQGLKDDRDYLGGITKLLLSKLWRGHELGRLKNPDDYQEALAISLLCDPKLEILSIWSPRLLVASLDYMKGNWSNLRTILALGSYSKPGFSLNFKPRLLAEDFHQADIFPNLKLVSSWGSAHGEADFEKLKMQFPNTWFQKKGLLATEAPISLPLVGEDGFAPLITEVYFEFKDSTGNIYDLTEAREGKVYELIFSTKGGLYRYSVGDLVLMKKSKTQTLFFDFIGRSGLVSDLCGEKLSERELEELFKDNENTLLFFPAEDHYIVFGNEAQQADLLEAKLLTSPHYHYARKAGQLKEIEYIKVEKLQEKVIEYFTKVRKMKAGDLKPQRLYPKSQDQALAAYLRS